MTHVESTSNIRRWFGNDEITFFLDFVVRPEFRLKETLLFPPGIPR